MQEDTPQPRHADVPLNELDKLFYSWELFGYHAMGRILFDFQGGHIDLELLRQAYAAEVRRRPVLNARIDDTVKGKGWQVRWKLRDEVAPDQTVRMCDFSDLSFEAAQEKVRLLQFDPFSGYSLRRDPPFFMTLCRLPAGCWKLLVFLHHALADAHGISMVLEELFVAYNQLADGGSIKFSTEQGRSCSPVPLLPENRRDLLKNIFSSLAFFTARAVLTRFKASTKIQQGTPTFQARTAAVHRAIAPEKLSGYLAAAKRGGITFNILLVAAQALAIQRWKQSRCEPCGLISMEVHENLRDGSQELQQLSNKFAPFIIDLQPRHRNDFVSLLCYIQQMQAQARKDAMAQKLVCLLYLLNTRLGLMMRRLWLNLVFNNSRLGDSSLVTNLGKLWTGTESCPPVTHLGDADITGYYMAGPPIASIGSYFAYLSYRGSLFFTFNYFEWVLPPADAERFIDLFEETLDELAGCL